jgi:hypothetical protein
MCEPKGGPGIKISYIERLHTCLLSQGVDKIRNAMKGMSQDMIDKLNEMITNLKKQNKLT